MANLIMTSKMPDSFFKGVIFVIKNYHNLFLQGIITTLALAIFGTLFGLIIGMFISLLRQTKVTDRDSLFVGFFKKMVSLLSLIYVQYLRGTPMLVQGMMVHLMINRAGYRIEPLVLGIFVVSINTSAYIAEILRASIQAIDKGQMEAARAIGMNETQGMFYFVIPQALKNAIPAIGNEFVANTKDSAVLNAIMVAELYYQANRISLITYRPLEPLFVISLVYLTTTLLSAQLLHFIEKKLDAPESIGTGFLANTIHHHQKGGTQ